MTFYPRLIFILITVVTTWSKEISRKWKEIIFQIKKQEGKMVNYTQIVFQNRSIRPLEGVPDKIYIDKFGAYVNGKTSGIHSNEGGGKLGYMSIS